MKVETVVGKISDSINRSIILKNYNNNMTASAYIDGNKIWDYHSITGTPIFNSIVGIDKVRFIQDSGMKYIDKIYFDNVTFKPYRPKNNTTDTDVTATYSPASIFNNSNKIANIMSFDDKSIDTGHKIIFKTGNADTTKDNGVVTFDTPFPNACLSVVFTDVTSNSLGSAIIALDVSTPITKNGFKAYGIIPNETQPVANKYNYLAIGY